GDPLRVVEAPAEVLPDLDLIGAADGVEGHVDHRVTVLDGLVGDGDVGRDRRRPELDDAGERGGGREPEAGPELADGSRPSHHPDADGAAGMPPDDVADAVVVDVANALDRPAARWRRAAGNRVRREAPTLHLPDRDVAAVVVVPDDVAGLVVVEVAD